MIDCCFTHKQGDEREVMKMGWVIKIIRSTNLDCHWKYRESWVGSDNLATCSEAEAPTPVRGLFPNTVHWSTMVCMIPLETHNPVVLWAEHPDPQIRVLIYLVVFMTA